MTGLIVKIKNITDAAQPIFVEAELVDYHGKKHIFRDKYPVFSSHEECSVPCMGEIRCVIINENDGSLVVDTSLIDGVNSVEGESCFEISKNQIRQIESSCVRINSQMKDLLQGIRFDDIPALNTFPVWEKMDPKGRTYWGTSHFWNLDCNGVSSTQDLSELEWNGNETNLEVDSRSEVPTMLRKTLGIIKAWQEQLEVCYGGTSFYILASYCDNSDEQNQRAFFATTTMRFWTERGGMPMTDFSDFYNWKEPAIVIFL